MTLRFISTLLQRLRGGTPPHTWSKRGSEYRPEPGCDAMTCGEAAHPID